MLSQVLVKPRQFRAGFAAGAVGQAALEILAGLAPQAIAERESPEGEQQLRLAPMPGKQGFGKLQPGARIAGLQQRICPHQLRIPFAPQRGGQQFRGIVAEPRARQAGGIGSQQCRMLSSRRG